MLLPPACRVQAYPRAGRHRGCVWTRGGELLAFSGALVVGKSE